MDHLWSPWRYSYVQKSESAGACIFCEMAARENDRENFVVYRANRNFVVLNLFPYTNGHMMVAPYEHVATLSGAAEETIAEMLILSRRAEGYLQSIYRPEGLNLGMNLGKSAGAGVAGHIHMHVLPRWLGDVNFMTTVGETRVLPESLEATYDKLAAAFRVGTVK